MECHGRSAANAAQPRVQPRHQLRVRSQTASFPSRAAIAARAGDKRIPHTYADDEPRLYYPPALEWRSDMKISASVVGWLAHWLHYYEIWYATGEWLGGGIDHGVNEETK